MAKHFLWGLLCELWPKDLDSVDNLRMKEPYNFETYSNSHSADFLNSQFMDY